MNFPVYDFDISTYRNVKKMYLSESIHSSNKANVLKSHYGDAEYQTHNDKTLHKLAGSDIYLIDGQEYIDYLEANSHDVQYPLDSTDDGTYDELDALFNATGLYHSEFTSTFPSTSHYGDSVGVKQYEADTAGSAKVLPNAIDLLGFIQAYQITEDYYRISLPDSTKLTIATTKEWFQDIRNALAAETGTVYLSPTQLVKKDPLLYDGYEESGVTGFQIGTNRDYKYINETIGILSDSYNYRFKKQFKYDYMRSQYFGSLAETKTVWTENGQEIIRLRNHYKAVYDTDTTLPASVDDGGVVIKPEQTVPSFTYTVVPSPSLPSERFSDAGQRGPEEYFPTTLVPDSEDEFQYKLYIVLEKVSEFFDNKVTAMIEMQVPVEDVLHVLDMYIAEAQVYIDLLAAQVTPALETPTGRMLGSVREVSDLVEMDISKMNEIWLVHRIYNMDSCNNMEDADERNHREFTIELLNKVPDWQKYVYPIVRRVEEGNFQDRHYVYKVIGYAPNWSTAVNLPNRYFMIIMQACGQRMEYGVPKPKSNWGKTIFAIVVIVVVTYLSWGSLTAETVGAFAPVLKAAAIVGTVASIAGILTQSKTWAKIGKVTAIASAATGAVQGAIRGMATSAIVQYAIRLVLMAQQYFNRKKLTSLGNELKATSEDVDEIEELTTEIEEQAKIKDFIYSDHHELTYTANYDYRYEWKYLSSSDV